MSNKATPDRPVDSANVASWHAETDALIIGGGGAGISAAIEAAEAGARVIVLEATRSRVPARALRNWRLNWISRWAPWATP